VRKRSGVVIVQNGQVALIERVRNGRVYYVVPGGNMEPGETPEETAVREAYEELGLRVRLEWRAATITYRDSIQYYFVASITGGDFGKGIGPEMLGQYPPERGTYRAVWLPVQDLSRREVMPRSIAEALIRGDLAEPVSTTEE